LHIYLLADFRMYSRLFCNSLGACVREWVYVYFYAC